MVVTGHTLGEIDTIVPCEELIVDLGQMDRGSHKKWRLIFMLFFRGYYVIFLKSGVYFYISL